MTTPSSSPSVWPGRPNPDAPENAAPVAVFVWLVIGGLTLGTKEFQAHIIVKIIVAICVVVQLFFIINMFTRMSKETPSRGGGFVAAGFVGLAITTFGLIALTDTMNISKIFWALSGIYFGWLFERATGLFGRCGQGMEQEPGAQEAQHQMHALGSYEPVASGEEDTRTTAGDVEMQAEPAARKDSGEKSRP